MRRGTGHHDFQYSVALFNRDLVGQFGLLADGRTMIEPSWLYPFVISIAVLCNIGIAFIIGKRRERARNAGARLYDYDLATYATARYQLLVARP